ncbi:hypothetical protein [Mesorhizobium sp.]|uniref:hypothetical protein n=1 Tax=Mesorhizobium sp. TaxID=1871066 RepID=UPI000FE2B9C3|nr:hypothetical protein [Mesorhizobium sp.]RWA68321.1 MAG: hypothetical protein EOQ28_25300 [Mesorhizobium sp.]RWB97532.1 MAG: hypothetical protein EOQ57_24220 [Mesorhizobium sp.]RWG82302.1 MAG: hypothetical protein EOQ69_16545 [Mesorhizobium sp.]RWG86981.1 MAG: hypothetical protein EOQ70_14760 [Mesorhizobium sp.]RWK03079.1 MAG: hypothetical protein EOR42_19125 [Mesorhizobium sp.]
MRSKSVRASFAAVTLAALSTAIAVPAEAGLRHHDRVYADSFGNLVIDSAAGYKRIIVGEGRHAKELFDFTRAGQPDVIYDSDDAGAPGCYQPPVFVKGRSYMYGLSDGEMPNLSPCR